VVPGGISAAAQMQPHMLTEWSNSIDACYFSDQVFDASNLLGI
jgi:hypothetical protein